MPEAPIGYAVVGLGSISQRAVLPAFRNARGNSRLTALVSGDPSKRRALAARYGLAKSATYSYEQYEACLEREDVDAVYIALPNHLHREYTERAAARGVHVLCEKPMAPSPADCRAMIQACDSAGVKLMIAYRLHLEPANLYAVRLAESGRIGRAQSFHGTFTEQVAEDDFRLRPPGEGGGPIHDIGIYCINAARYLFRAEPEWAWATRASPDGSGGGDLIACVLRFPGGRLATFTCGFGPHPVATLELVGTAGGLRMANAFTYRGDRAMEVLGDAAEVRTFPERDQFGPQLTYLADCILDDRRPEPDGEEGLIDVEIIHGLHGSLESGRPVSLALERERRPGPRMAMEYPPVPEPDPVRGDGPAD